MPKFPCNDPLHGIDREPHILAENPYCRACRLANCRMRFKDGDPDSTLILAFSPEGTNGRIDLVHLDAPAHNYQDVVEGLRRIIRAHGGASSPADAMYRG